MKILIVCAHPEPRSFNGAMFTTAIKTLTDAGHIIQQSNLYEMAFNPVYDRHNFIHNRDANYFKPQLEEEYATEVNGFVTDVELEIQKLEWCDLMIWQFPFWWYAMPAILKGWVDRVFVMGRTYASGRFYDTGIFKGKKAMLSITTGGPEHSYFKDGYNGDISVMLKPVHRGILEFTGFSVLAPQIIYTPDRKSPEELKDELAKWNIRLEAIENELPVAISNY